MKFHGPCKHCLRVRLFKKKCWSKYIEFCAYILFVIYCHQFTNPQIFVFIYFFSWETYWFCLFRQADDMPTGFAKIKDMTILGIGAAVKCFDTYSDMALAYILYTWSYSGVHIKWKKSWLKMTVSRFLNWNHPTFSISWGGLKIHCTASLK